LVILNVILRYFFSHSIFWAEEVATICFVWTVFVGASAVYKNRMDVGIDILVTKAPLDVQIFIRGLVRFLLLVINGYIFYMSVVFTKISMIKSTAVLGISSAVVNGALIVGFGLILIHTIRFMIKDVRQKYSS
jgi:TRAP-type C4-dicarboxylate transport system permease small subunit